MGKTATKIKELEYNELAALAVIEKDEDLKSIFQEDVKLSFNMLRTLSQEGTLSLETQNLIKELFDKIILTKTNLINSYAQLISAEGGEVKVIQTIEETNPIVADAPKTSSKPKKEKVLPRRYGKTNIMQDIVKQGGKATNAQTTALIINNLKNIYVNLNARLIREMLGEPSYTDVDYRDIRSAITIVQNKLKPILAKK